MRIIFQLLTFSLLSDIVSSNQRSYKLQDIKHEMEKDEAIFKSFNDVVLWALYLIKAYILRNHSNIGGNDRDIEAKDWWQRGDAQMKVSFKYLLIFNICVKDFSLIDILIDMAISILAIRAQSRWIFHEIVISSETSMDCYEVFRILN